MRVVLPVVLSLAIALPVAAQRPDTTRMRMGGQHRGMQHDMPGRRGMQGNMSGMGGMAGMDGMMMGDAAKFAPDKLLAQRDALGLSDEQVARLTELDQAATTAADQAHQPAHAAMQTLQTELAEPEPDTAKVHAYLNAHTTAMGNVMWIRVRAALEAKALLTDAQRARVVRP